MRPKLKGEPRWRIAQEKEKSYWARPDVLPSQATRVFGRYGPLIAELSRDLPARIRILDVGSGPTCAAQLFPFGSKTYLDPLMRSYERDYELAPGAMVCGVAERIPARAESYDVVVCVNALDHFCDPETAVAEVHRVLRSGGIFLLGVFLFPSPIAALRRFIDRYFPVAREDAHPHSFSRRGIRDLVSGYFEVAREVQVFQDSTAGIHALHREDRLFVCSKAASPSIS